MKKSRLVALVRNSSLALAAACSLGLPGLLRAEHSEGGVELTGPGTFILTRVGGSNAVDKIELSETSKASTLTIKVDPGTGGSADNAEVRTITGVTPLKTILAPGSKLTTAIDLPGGVGAVTVADTGPGVVLHSGANPQLKQLRFTAQQVGAGFALEAPGQTLTFTAEAVAAATISALNVGKFTVTDGGFAGTLSSPGKIVSVSVIGGDLAATILAATIGPMRFLKDDALQGGNLVNSLIGAAKIGAITVAGDVINSKIIAGANFGADHALGGTGADADSFDQGTLGSITIGGPMKDSFIGAGYTPFDSLFGNTNDGVHGEKKSKIGKITVASIDAASRFGAGKFSGGTIGGVKINVLTDAHFVTRRYKKGIVAPDPVALASPVPSTVVTTFYEAVKFLFEKQPLIQTGVAPGTILPDRVAVLRGVVRGREGLGVAGVNVTILGHPEFGETHTRADGGYDIAVNGGGPLDVVFECAGCMMAQRRVEAPLLDYAVLPDVAVIPVDPRMTVVTFGPAAPLQAHVASVESDGDGNRHGFVIFPAGTKASLLLPDGTLVPVKKLTIRATEYTVGPDGDKAMPGALPPNSAYTYCIELSADEAEAAGAISVVFDREVFFYVDNFLDFPIGTIVPAGSFNRARGEWEPGPSGRVLKLLAINAGLADLDADGDSNADDPAELAALGITDAERTALAQHYTAPKSLWRTPMLHFSPNDLNWPPSTGRGPQQGPPKYDYNTDPDDPPNVFIQSQALGESVSLADLPFRLHYRSNRVSGRTEARRIRIPLSDSSAVPDLKRIELTVKLAGRVFKEEFPPDPNQSKDFVWDGKDAYGRELQGRQLATVEIGYVYDAAYQSATVFGANGTTVPVAGPNFLARREFIFPQKYTVPIGAFDLRRQSVGGWTLDVHHAYDPLGRVLFLGDGSVRSVTNVTGVISTTAGTNTQGFSGDGGPALTAQLNTPLGVALAADGSVLIADSGNSRIRRVGPDGRITTIAGSGDASSSGNGGPALQAGLAAPAGVHAGPGGQIYLEDSGQVRKLPGDGTIVAFAGSTIIPAIVASGPAPGADGDDGKAIEANLSQSPSSFPTMDGAVVIGDGNRVRRVSTDGIIRAFAGSGENGFSGDGGPALEAKFAGVREVALAADGTAFVADLGNNRIRRIGIDGFITTYAGGGNDPADGIPATQALLDFSTGTSLAVGRDGTLYFTERARHRVRAIAADGLVTTVAGDGQPGFAGDGGPATAAHLNFPSSLAAAPDGGLYIADSFNNRIRRVAPPLPGFTATQVAIPSEDGTQLYRFDAAGRHLETRDTFTGAVLFTFAYNADGQLAKLTDGDGNETTIERTTAGAPTAIVAPFGHRTLLTADANGTLASLQDPPGGAWSFTNSPGGLLLAETDPAGAAHTFQYDTGGRLLTADFAGAPLTTLARVELPDGFRVGISDALRAEGTFQIESFPDRSELRTNTNAAGLPATERRSANGVRFASFRSGFTMKSKSSADLRLGYLAPFTSELVIATPGGRSLTISATRSPEATPGDPLSLIKQDETVSIGNALYQTSYDAVTRVSEETSPLARRTRETRDAAGRPARLETGSLEPLTLAYDARGRLTNASAGPVGAARTFTTTYDAQGRVAKMVDPMVREIVPIYDAAARLTSLSLPGARSLGFGYDSKGRVTSVTPPSASVHRFDYTPFDGLSSYTAPQVGPNPNVTLFEHAADNELTKVTLPDGATINYGYDAAGRLASRTTAASATTFAYSMTTGMLTSATTPGVGAVTFTHDGPVTLSETWSGTVAGSVARGIDDELRTVSQQINGANPVAFAYDADGLLTVAGALGLNRDLDTGRITTATLDMLSESNGYNGFGELTSRRASVTGSEIFAQTMTRDALARITQKVETISGATDTFAYSYDAAGQLSAVLKNGASVASYAYDGNGNRTSANGVAATFDAQDRITSLGTTTYAHTAAGFRQSKTAGGQTTQYSYDAAGNLRSVTLPGGTLVEYVIDGFNRRIGRKVGGVLGQGFLYDGQYRVVAELDGADAVVSRFIYGTRATAPDYLVKGGVTYRLLGDPNGSVRLVVNATTGAIAQRLDYDPFGQVLGDTAPGFQPFGFASGLYDPLTGLVRFGARDYDAEAGRWTARDPIYFDSGAINLYAYANSEPLNAIDPTGLEGFNLEEILPYLDPYGSARKIKEIEDINRKNREHYEDFLEAVKRNEETLAKQKPQDQAMTIKDEIKNLKYNLRQIGPTKDSLLASGLRERLNEVRRKLSELNNERLNSDPSRFRDRAEARAPFNFFTNIVEAANY
ncbi:MAG: hypothetical protein QOE70_2561 [Chthoniobacter sp.]|jgi:RHS repeat-associated protein|nr:hypothetical protein [Chthoniobacter sp.]